MAESRAGGPHREPRSVASRRASRSGTLILIALITSLLIPSGAAADGGLTAQNDLYSVQAGGTLNVPAPGVLANDTNPDLLLPMVALIATLPANGTATLLATGALIYVPNVGFSGTDEFTYQASTVLHSSIARVRIDVSPVPAPTPTATPTPTVAPTPTPTPIPTPTPTSGPTATPTPTSPPASSAPPSPSPSRDPAASPDPSRSPSPNPDPGRDPAAPASPGPGTSAAGGAPTTSAGLGGSSGSGDGPGPVANDGPYRLAADGGDVQMDLDLASVNLARPGALFVWAVPGVVVSVPGLLVILVIGAQAIGGLAWLPLARKRIGAFGLGRRGRRDKTGPG